MLTKNWKSMKYFLHCSKAELDHRLRTYKNGTSKLHALKTAFSKRKPFIYELHNALGRPAAWSTKNNGAKTNTYELLNKKLYNTQ